MAEEKAMKERHERWKQTDAEKMEVTGPQGSSAEDSDEDNEMADRDARSSEGGSEGAQLEAQGGAVFPRSTYGPKAREQKDRKDDKTDDNRQD